MYDISQINKVIVHAGTFHADDVFSVAYINLMKKYLHQAPVQVIRAIRNPAPAQNMENGYLAIDIGKGEFDPHQDDESKKICRADGNAYAAFGLVVKAFHEGFLNEDEYELLDRKFIKPLDMYENSGRNNNQLAQCIVSFNKNWDAEASDSNTRFTKAVEVATVILDQYIDNLRSLARAKKLADEAEVDGETVYLDRYAPIHAFFADRDEVKFIGFPSSRSGYQVVSVKNSMGENKKLFPECLRGLNLKSKCNSAGLNFCHNDGFMAIFQDKDAAKRYMDTLFTPNE